MSSTGVQDLLSATGSAASAGVSVKTVAALDASDFLQSLSNAVRSLGTRSNSVSVTGSDYETGDFASRSVRSAGQSAASAAGGTSARGASSSHGASGNQGAGGQSAGGSGNFLRESAFSAGARNSFYSQKDGACTNVAGEEAATDATAGLASGDEEDPTAEEPADMDAALAMLPFIAGTDTTGQEALNRIASLTANGVIDGEILSGLSDEQVTQLADWALAGAGGLLPPFGSTADMSGLSATTDALTGPALADFGLGRAAQAMTQMQMLQQTLTAAGATGVSALPAGLTADGLVASGMAAAADMSTVPASVPQTAASGAVDAGSLSELLRDLDGTGGLSQAALARIAATVQSGLAAETGAGAATQTVSQLVQSAPAGQLQMLIDQGLTAEGAQPLPELPEAVVQSLGVTILSSSQGDSTLLSGLDNNLGLRAALLAQSGATANTPQTPATAVVEDTHSQAALLSVDTPAPTTATAGTQVAPEVTAAPVESATAQATLATEQAASTGHAVPVTAQADAEAPVVQAQPAVVAESSSATGDFGGDAGSGEQSLRDQAALLQSARQTASDAVVAAGTSFSPASAFAREMGSALTSADDSLLELSGNAIGATSSAATAGGTGASPSVPADSTVRYAQMSENIDRLQKLLQSAASGSGLKSLTMQLNPEELGKLTINLELRDGAVHATIKTDNDTARDLLLSGSDQLKKTLDAAGVKLDSFDVSVNQEGYDEPDGRNQAGWRAAQEEREKHRNGGSSRSADVAQAEVAADTGTLPGGALNIVA